MRNVWAIRVAGLLLVCASISARLRAQGGVPVATPVQAIAPAGSDSVPVATRPAVRVPEQMPAHRADVTYKDGQLAVRAENSSLNQILREIGRQTHIKITGGVAEERVYGSYGPAGSAEVLAALLNGTSSNMLLLSGSEAISTELVLTPRVGGATPPGPNAGSDRGEEDVPVSVAPDGSIEPDGRTARRAPEAQTPEMQTQGQPSSQTTASPAADQGAAPAATPAGGDTAGQSSTGAKTPQQIYDQLMQMQKQQQAKP